MVQFPVFSVDATTKEALEPMGTKRKYWFSDRNRGPCLFKAIRSGTGEDWAEKLAAEIATLLDIPHATYELAQDPADRGTISHTFVRTGDSLVHGNELLTSFDPTYVEFDSSKARAGYTVDAVLAALKKAEVSVDPEMNLPAEIDTAGGLFAGYLMLDALIGNTDRHHENWAVVERTVSGARVRYLAPTFDHASSLGRNESPERMRVRLATKDSSQTVEAYSARAKSPFFSVHGKRLTPIESYREASLAHSKAAAYWLGKLRSLEIRMIEELLAAFPSELMPAPTPTFVTSF